jgi:hypothetical protein
MRQLSIMYEQICTLIKNVQKSIKYVNKKTRKPDKHNYHMKTKLSLQQSLVELPFCRTCVALR